MCGRFDIHSQPKVIEKRFGAKFSSTAPGWRPTYNAAPTQLLPIITNLDSSRVTLAKWGFIPEWAPKKSILKPQINARIAPAKLDPTLGF